MCVCVLCMRCFLGKFLKTRYVCTYHLDVRSQAGGACCALHKNTRIHTYILDVHYMMHTYMHVHALSSGGSENPGLVELADCALHKNTLIHICKYIPILSSGGLENPGLVVPTGCHYMMHTCIHIPFLQNPGLVLCTTQNTHDAHIHTYLVFRWLRESRAGCASRLCTT